IAGGRRSGTGSFARGDDRTCRIEGPHRLCRQGAEIPDLGCRALRPHRSRSPGPGERENAAGAGRAGMNGHAPVMLTEVIAALAPRDGALYVDGTFGGGGYSRAILEAADCRVLGIDRDPDAIARGQALIAHFGGRLSLVEGEFSRMDSYVEASDGVVLDLGVSSFQFDQPERGFSFRADGPLDM